MGAKVSDTLPMKFSVPYQEILYVKAVLTFYFQFEMEMDMKICIKSFYNYFFLMHDRDSTKNKYSFTV